MCAAEIQADFIREIRCFDSGRYLDYYLFYSAAPVLKGVKPAALVTLKPSCLDVWARNKRKFCAQTGLFIRELCHRDTFFIVLVYDAGALLSVRENEIADRILSSLGYPDTGEADTLLAHLEVRFSGEFPHEVGLFLGYPADDVQSFIRYKGKNYVCCRHWKVYHNEEKALDTFRCIDEARLLAIDIISRQKSVCCATRELRAIGACTQGVFDDA